MLDYLHVCKICEHKCEPEIVLFWTKTITVKLGDKEPFDKEQISVKEPFPVANC